MNRLGVAAVLAVAACGSDEELEPITGDVHVFRVDGFTMPHTITEARELGCSLNGDKTIDNQLGAAISTQAQEGNVTPYVNELIGAGVLDSFVMIQADDETVDPSVGVRYAGYPGAPSVSGRGHIDNGAFTWDIDPAVRGSGVVRLPVFIDANVSQVQVESLVMSLAPDGTGGFDGLLCGALHEREALEDSARALIQMINNNPADHRFAIEIFDADQDGVTTVEEVTTNSLLGSSLSPDVTIEGKLLLSMGVGVHLTRCESADSCPPLPAIVNTCRDRLIDGDESDIDCGGSCRACGTGGSLCRGPADCTSQICESGVCRAPACDDGARDGYESDVDCGWNCAKCVTGKMCERSTDCATGPCIAKVCQ